MATLGQLVLLRARSQDPAQALQARRRANRLAAVEHVALAVLLAAGFALMLHRGWRPSFARWLGLKLGLVTFLVLPLELMHAYVSHVWIARGLRRSTPGAPAKDLQRGVSMDDMLRTLAVVLLGAGVPLIIWLSVAKPW